MNSKNKKVDIYQCSYSQTKPICSFSFLKWHHDEKIYENFDRSIAFLIKNSNCEVYLYMILVQKNIEIDSILIALPYLSFLESASEA